MTNNPKPPFRDLRVFRGRPLLCSVFTAVVNLLVYSCLVAFCVWAWFLLLRLGRWALDVGRWTFAFSLFLLISDLCPLTSSATADVVPQYRWTVNAETISSQPLTIRRGESLDLVTTWKNYGSLINLTGATNVVLWYRPSTVITGFWAYSVTGTVTSATGGVTTVRWTPACESTNRLYNFDLCVASTNALMVRGKGTITLEGTLVSTTNATPTALNVYDWLAVLAAITNSSGSGIIPEYRWTVNAETVASQDLIIRRGETLDLMTYWKNYGSAMNLTNATSVGFYYRPSNITTGAWAHILTGSVYSVTGGITRCRWTSAQEGTNSLYNYDLLVGTSNSCMVRAKGKLTLDSSLVAGSNQVATLFDIINWATVNNLNVGSAPFMIASNYYSKTESDARYSTNNHLHTVANITDAGTAARSNATDFASAAQGIAGTNAQARVAALEIKESEDTNSLSSLLSTLSSGLSAHSASNVPGVHGTGSAAKSNATDFASAAQGTKADTAFGWGNHASAGYSTNKTFAQTLAYSTNNADLQSITNAGNIQSAGNISASGTCLVVTGSITPDATGTYLATLPYNGYPCFALGTTYVIWYDTVNSDYWITTAAQKGTSRPNGWWRYSTTCTGTYAHLDPPYTGTATATATPAFGNVTAGEYSKYGTNIDLLYASILGFANHSASNVPGVHGTGSAAKSNATDFASAAQGVSATDALARVAIVETTYLPATYSPTDTLARAQAAFASNGVLELNGLTNGYNCAFTNVIPSWGTNDSMSFTGQTLYVCFNTNVSSSSGGTTNLFAGSGSTGLVTSAGGDAGKYLKADGTWATPASGGGGDIYSTNNNVFSGSNTLGITTFTNVPTVNGTPVSTSTTAAASSTYDERTNIAAITAISLQTNIVVGSAKPIIPDFAVWASSTSAFNQVMLVNIWESTNVASARFLREYESLVYVTTLLSTITNVAAGTNIITCTSGTGFQAFDFVVLQQNAGAAASEWAYVTNRSVNTLYLRNNTINTYTGGLATVSRVGIYSPQQYINTLGQSLLPCTFTFPYAPTVTVTTLLKEIY